MVDGARVNKIINNYTGDECTENEFVNILGDSSGTFLNNVKKDIRKDILKIPLPKSCVKFATPPPSQKKICVCIYLRNKGLK